jgi:iron complex outermembrane receptor protein
METNSALEPETNLNYEIGLRSQTRLFGWKTMLNSSLFYINRKDFITSSIGQYVNGNAETDEVFDIYDNIGHTTSKGFELAMHTEKKHNVSFDFAYTFLINKFESYDNFFLALGNPYARTQVDSEAELVDPLNQVFFKHYDNSGNYVPRSPMHSANFRTHWYPTSKLTITTEIDYRGESYADEINQEKLPARTLINVGLVYKTKAQVSGGRASDLTLFFKVDNIMDDQFYSIARAHADGNYDGVYNAEDLSINVDPGRVFMAGFKVKF